MSEIKGTIKEFDDSIITINIKATETYKNLQQRINKAIEYIQYNNETLYTYEPDYDYEENIVDNYDVSSFREDLLEILKGDK